MIYHNYIYIYDTYIYILKIIDIDPLYIIIHLWHFYKVVETLPIDPSANKSNASVSSCLAQ